MQEENRPAGLAPAQRIGAARRTLDERHLGELGEAVRRQAGERRQRAELLGGGMRAQHQNSRTRLFCSICGRNLPAHSSISSMVGSISPGFMCVM